MTESTMRVHTYLPIFAIFIALIKVMIIKLLMERAKLG